MPMAAGHANTLLSSVLVVPYKFSSVLHSYVREGYRVLACAYRPLPHSHIQSARHLSRQEAEQHLSLSGLLILQNAVKPESQPAINCLRSANIDCAMITGDNPLTACHVARTCGIIAHASTIYISEGRLHFGQKLA
jgi:cation-transporting P-type ATPase 13A2